MCGTDHFLVQKVQIFFKFISRIPRVAAVTKSGACSIVHCVIGFKMHDFKNLFTLTYDLHQCHTRTFATSVNRWWLHKNNQNARIIAWPFPFLTAKPILPAGLNNANTAGFISAQASHWYELRFHLFIYLFLQTLLTIPRKQGLELTAPSLVGAIRGTISDVISHFGCFFPPTTVNGLQWSDFSDVCICFHLKFYLRRKCVDCDFQMLLGRETDSAHGSSQSRSNAKDKFTSFGILALNVKMLSVIMSGCSSKDKSRQFIIYCK